MDPRLLQYLEIREVAFLSPIEETVVETGVTLPQPIEPKRMPGRPGAFDWWQPIAETKKDWQEAWETYGKELIDAAGRVIMMLTETRGYKLTTIDRFMWAVIAIAKELQPVENPI